jgi:predicted transcriptional regulator
MVPGPKPKYHELISLRLEPELRKLLEELAEEEDRTTSQMARILLRDGLATKGKKIKKLEKVGRQ